jgi:hypothetical protein
MENTTYDPAISREKGLDAGATATVGGAIVTVVQVGVALSQGGTLTEAAAAGLVSAVVTLGAAGAAGFRAWWRNRKKHRKPRRNTPQGRDLDYGALSVLLMSLSLFLAGCLATQAQDGTWTLQVDQSALDKSWDRYEELLSRERTLKEEKKNAAPQRVEAIAKELEAIAPKIKDLADALGVKLE